MHIVYGSEPAGVGTGTPRPSCGGQGGRVGGVEGGQIFLEQAPARVEEHPRVLLERNIGPVPHLDRRRNRLAEAGFSRELHFVDERYHDA